MFQIKFRSRNKIQRRNNSQIFTISTTTNEITKRVATFLENKNNKNEFIKEFAKNEGFAIWEKAIVTKKSTLSSLQASSLVGNDTLVIIPLVLQNTNLVNGYIEAIINDSINILNYKRTDYSTLPFGTLTSTTYTAEKYQLFMMRLDRIVFGVDEFKVIDNRLFQNPLESNEKIKTIKLTSIPEQTNLESYFICDEICISYTNICNICHKLSCSISTYTSYCTENCTEFIESGGVIIAGSGAGSPAPSNGITNQPGTIPLLPENPIDISNPCGVIDSLMKMPNYRQMLQKLRDSTNLPYEIGTSFTNPLDSSNFSITNYSGLYNNINNLASAVDIDLFSPVDGVAHSHNNSLAALPNASGEDIYKLANYFMFNKMNNYRTFTYPIVTNNSSYILMVTDSIAFRNFAINFLGNKEKLDIFIESLYITHHYGDFGNTISENEINFIKCLKNPDYNNTGISVFRGNTNMTHFTRIQLNNNNTQVVEVPCNE